VKKLELKSFITEKYNYKLVNHVAKQLKWDYNTVTEFVRDLLTDINYHDESQKVYNFMKKL